VIDVYAEYCVAELNTSWKTEEVIRSAGSNKQLRAQRSSAKFLINSAISAIQSKHARYLEEQDNKSNWTADDYDIRFIVQVVKGGRYRGHWWEN
jgi:hypothetical protein